MEQFYYDKEKVEKLLETAPLTFEYNTGVLDGYICVANDLDNFLNLTTSMLKDGKTTQEAYTAVKAVWLQTVGTILYMIEPYIKGEKYNDVLPNTPLSKTQVKFYYHHAPRYNEYAGDADCNKYLYID